jgi:very-short-patch-repair endonuclease
VYRCFHCHDLHVAAEQAKDCSRSDSDRYAEALLEVDRILARGPIPCRVRKAMREEASWTLPERRLWKALEEHLPGEVRSQWWIPGCEYRVDFFIPSTSLAVEVDGESQAAPVGADRLRSSVLRSHGVTILRIPSALAMGEPDRLASAIAGRVHDRSALAEAVPA